MNHARDPWEPEDVYRLVFIVGFFIMAMTTLIIVGVTGHG